MELGCRKYLQLSKLATKYNWDASNAEFKGFVRANLKGLVSDVKNLKDNIVPVVIRNETKIKIHDKFMWTILSFIILFFISLIVAFAKNPTITGNAIKAIFS